MGSDRGTDRDHAGSLRAVGNVAINISNVGRPLPSLALLVLAFQVLDLATWRSSSR
jgi:hypothetical protein